MKKNVLIICLGIVFVIELGVLIIFNFKEENTNQNTVEINEVVHLVQDKWEDISDFKNPTTLKYVIINMEGNVLYKTNNDLSETINDAILHKDTIVDVTNNSNIVGKIIFYNEDEIYFTQQKDFITIILLIAVIAQWAVCIGYTTYFNSVIITPFTKLKEFAERIAKGNLDIPLEMDKHNLFGAFTESFDIMRSELKNARAAEAKANNSKKELVAKLSHDIKTPVASIKAVAEVGAAVSKTSKEKETYQSIIKKADQIDQLITNLFSATLEELQQLIVEPKDTNSSILKELLETSDYLHYATIPTIPECLIYADSLRLQQVFDNIFANSYKYAKTKIDVSVELKEKNIYVTIEDFGGGVHDEELVLIKEKFKRGSNATNIEGSGLGLYISDYFMQQMKGNLVIENTNQGLKVIVIIPLSQLI